MYRIIDSRSSGKTSRLMLIAKENNAVFVCSNPYAMRAKAEAYGIVGINFIDYHEFLNSQDDDLGPYVIDELESFLRYVANAEAGHNKCIGYTLSCED